MTDASVLIALSMLAACSICAKEESKGDLSHAATSVVCVGHVVCDWLMVCERSSDV